MSMVIVLCGLKKTQDRQANLEQKKMDCCICLETITSGQYTTKCTHCYCEKCILDWFISRWELGQSITTCPCPLCRSDIIDDILIYSCEIDEPYDLDYVDEEIISMTNEYSINTWIALEFW